MKVAIVHDYLKEFGGAEEVLAVLHEMYPVAPIYVSVLDVKRMGHFMDKFKGARIITSWFNYVPFASRLISPLRFLIPLIWSSFDFSDYDLVISSASWAVTKGFKKGKQTVEICYLHTPPRYLYGYDTSRIWRGRWYGIFVDAYSLIVNHFMRLYDFNQAQKVDYFIANSKNIGLRIEKYYRRKDYKVIYPPINSEEINKIKTTADNNKFYLTGGRMTVAKNFDLIIKAFNKNKKDLRIFGGGIEETNLKKIANANIKFLGKVSDARKFELLRSCKAFILAQKDEDAGMTAVEVQAGGKPAIAFKGGGYVEVIKENETGIFFSELSIASLNNAILKFEKIKFDKNKILSWAKKFSKARFKKEMLEFVNGAR